MASENDPTPRFPTMAERKRLVQLQYKRAMAKAENDPAAANLGAFAADNSLFLHQHTNALITAAADGSALDQPPDAGQLDMLLRLLKETQKLYALEREFGDADPPPGTRVRR